MTTGRINQVTTVRRKRPTAQCFRAEEFVTGERPQGPHPPRSAGERQAAAGGIRFPPVGIPGRCRQAGGAVRAAAAWAPPVKARSAVAGAQALTAAGGWLRVLSFSDGKLPRVHRAHPETPSERGGTTRRIRMVCPPRGLLPAAGGWALLWTPRGRAYPEQCPPGGICSG